MTQHPLHRAGRVAYRALLAVASVLVGWLAGSAVGTALGLGLDAATGEDWVSWIYLTVPVGGLTGILAGAAIGWRVGRR